MSDEDIHGLVRNPDHSTSIAAAKHVSRRKPTIRKQVEQFFRDRPYGATDSELKAAFPQAPESSFRKRRTELAQENVLLHHGQTRTNEHGESEKVWLHRDHALFPPDLKPREAKPSRFTELQEENARLRARIADLEAYIQARVPSAADLSQ